MSRPTLTARHETPSVELREMCGVILTTPGIDLTLTWEQGDDAGALALLDRAYADVKRQITGMTTIVHAEHVEDDA